MCDNENQLYCVKQVELYRRLLVYQSVPTKMSMETSRKPRGIVKFPRLFVLPFGHCVFEPPFGGGGLGTTYDVYLGLTGKRVVDFLLVIIVLLSLGVTAEALRSNIGDYAPTRSL